MTPRLYLQGARTPGEILALPPEQSHYVTRVLRLRAGDEVVLFDGRGSRALARVRDADPKRCLLESGEPSPGLPESPLRICLAQCLSTGDKMDWTIEKAVELGVHTIVAVFGERSVVRLDAERAARRVEHWQRLIQAACAQCGRDVVPALREPLALNAWLDETRPAGSTALVLAPGAATRLGALAHPGPDVTLLVGPESGLSQAEVARAVAAGFTAVSLGPRVLRTETAGLAAIAALQARFGDL